MLAGGKRGSTDHPRAHGHQPQRHDCGQWIILWGLRKRPWEPPADMLLGACNLFKRMPTTNDDTTNRFIIENIIFEGVAGAAPFDPEETQSQDGRIPFMADTFDHGGMDDPFVQGQDGIGSTFPVDHEFPKDYGLEEDEVDIDGAPLFKDEFPNQANVNKKRKSKRMKAYTKDEDKLLCECWRHWKIPQDRC
ncbi:DNA repair protein rhp54 [Hordeum vulgare]|nr:DNA repair protein rhp54 [Hordeum vulgare]